jgi:hypothetical protein
VGEAEWLACEDPTQMLKFLSQPTGDYSVLEFLPERASQRKLRLFCVACCRTVWDHITESELREAVDLSEAFADDWSVRPKLIEVSRVVNDMGMEDWSRGFVGIPMTMGLWERSSAVWEASKEKVRPEGVAAKVALVAGEERDDGPTSRINAAHLRDILGNPFRTVAFSPEWRTDTALSLARQMYESRDFGAMPILADALQDAGCDSEDVLNHCRSGGVHVRGCWVIDLVLGRE